jgi:DUF4097 and DUF4098 domain-containing protein YvlB
MPTIPRRTARVSLPILALSVAIVSTTACDIATADLKHAVTGEWRKTYTLEPGGRLEISNVNGRIRVDSAPGDQIEIVAEKKGKGASEDTAKQAMDRIEIKEDVSGSTIRIETKTPRSGGGLFGGSTEVSYSVRVPAGAEVKLTTVNGGIELSRLSGRITAETTNGAITAREVGGALKATTTNGGIDVELTQLANGGVTLGCTNGGIKLRLPAGAPATISASTSNGGIDTSGLTLDTTESTQRSLEARMNGGGPVIKLEGTNGGIRIAAR